MPFSVALTDLLEAKIYCKSEGQYSINTLHYAVSSIVGVALSDFDILIALEPTFSGPVISSSKDPSVRAWISQRR